MGWNRVMHDGTGIFNGMKNDEFFYFVHGYGVTGKGVEVCGRSEYGTGFAAAVRQGKIYGVQFHPEKSGAAGLELLRNWRKSWDM